ncbi:hypothetical protein EJ02DRAFT_513431 [Clathrospora elynae]|uniref:DUF7730 domain-containing protein n=1 Tax=Clathrospora elynae TaxID=706981 RepID=A0A6A5SIU2_9PLEO|nr:hypothetical protein EJ02DRAFT_513431 [Clathrospora elynae]
MAIPWACGSIIYEKTKESKLYKETKQSFKNKKPAVRSRRRRVSFDASQTHFSMQMESPFFRKLPAELRNAVYEHLVQDEVYIVFMSGVIRSYSSDDPRVKHLGQSVVPAGDHQSSTGWLGMLQTCRRMYSETITLVYSTTKFRIQDYDSFFSFTATILPQRFQSIRRLHIVGKTYLREGERKSRSMDRNLNYQYIKRVECRNPILPNGPYTKHSFSAFAALCTIIGQMAGLEELHMELDIPWPTRYFPYFDMYAMPQLEGLSALKLRTFDVAFTEESLTNMGWTCQPFVNGVRQSC